MMNKLQLLLLLASAGLHIATTFGCSASTAATPGREARLQETRPAPELVQKAPEPKLVRVLVQPQRVLELTEAQRFIDRATSLIRPFELSDIRPKRSEDLKGAFVISNQSKRRDDGLTVTVILAASGAVQPTNVVVYHKTGDVTPLDKYQGRLGTQVIRLYDPDAQSESNRLGFQTVIIYERDGALEHVYTADGGVWTHELYSVEQR